MRNSQQEADGIVGEVVFPNTVPPFFPSFVLFAGPPEPENYEHRLAGIRAHNRWLVDWCDEFPERRAGIGQIFLNDIDDAIDDVALDQGARPARRHPAAQHPAATTWVKPIYDPEYDPLWEVCQDLEVPVNVHGGTGAPDYGPYPVSMLLYINEVPFYSQRPLVHLILSGVFERFPRLKFVITEQGCAWVPPLLDAARPRDPRHPRHGCHRRDPLRRGPHPPEGRHRVLPPELLDGREPAGPGRRRRPREDRRSTGSCGAATTRTTRARSPYTREHLRSRFHDVPEAELREILAGNAAELYDFDLDALAPLAAEFGPTVDEIAQPIDDVPRQAAAAPVRRHGSQGDQVGRLPFAELRVDCGARAPQSHQHSAGTAERLVSNYGRIRWTSPNSCQR